MKTAWTVSLLLLVGCSTAEIVVDADASPDGDAMVVMPDGGVVDLPDGDVPLADGGGGAEDAGDSGGVVADGGGADAGVDAGGDPSSCGNGILDVGEVCDPLYYDEETGEPRMHNACSPDCATHRCERYGPGWVLDPVSNRCLSIADGMAPYRAEGLVWWRTTAERDHLFAMYQSQLTAFGLPTRGFIRARRLDAVRWYWDIPGRPAVTDIPWARSNPYTGQDCAMIQFQTDGTVEAFGTNCAAALGGDHYMVKEPPPAPFE